MPNHVTHKIIFDASKAEEIFALVCPEGKFDFETLIPSPLHIYQGDLSVEDEKDFPDNWLSWNRKNWGTKWNAYNQSCGIENGQAYIKFDVAWSIPYPIISAFANKFNIPFEHRYYDEGSNFWGIEKWDKSQFADVICRVSKDQNNKDNEISLCVELKGYNTELNEEEDV